MADGTMETTKECACGECDAVTWCSREPLYVGSYVVSHIWLCNACVVKRAQARKQAEAQANEPRAIIRHFVAAMERKLAENDDCKDDWMHANWRDLFRALRQETMELYEALDAWAEGMYSDEATMLQEIRDEAADVGNLSAILAQRVGALPPTDERGR